MNNVFLLAIDPEKRQKADLEEIQRFTNQMNDLYEPFQFHFDYIVYQGSLSRDRNGRFQVKKMQNMILPLLPKCTQCFLIFCCNITELSQEELNVLMDNLNRAKKGGARVWTRNPQGIQQTLRGIAGFIAGINDRLPVASGDLEKLTGLERQLFAQGLRQRAAGQMQQAEYLLQRALMIQRKLALTDRAKYLPGLADVTQEIGTLMIQTRRLKEAEHFYQQSLSQRMELPETEGPGQKLALAGAYNNLGILHMEQTQYEEAENRFGEALAIYRSLAEEPAGEPERDDLVLRALADALGNQGTLFNRMKRPDDAAPVYEEMLGLLRDLMKKYPEELPLKSKFANAANVLGSIYNGRRDFEASAALLEENEKVYTELAEKDAAVYEPRLAQTCYNLFITRRALNQPKESQTWWAKAKEICQRRREDSEICRNLLDLMAKEQETAEKRQTAAADAEEKRADEALEEGNLRGAAEAMSNAARLYRGLPGITDQLKSAELFGRLADLLWDAGNMEQAEICLKNRVTICRDITGKDETYLPELAEALFMLGRFDDEVREHPDNESLAEALKVAERCKDRSEKAMDVWENLEGGAFLVGGRPGKNGEAGETEEKNA